MELRLTCKPAEQACRRLGGSFSMPRESAFRIRGPGLGLKCARRSPQTCATISTAWPPSRESAWMRFRATYDRRHGHDSVAAAARVKLTLSLQGSYTFTS